MIAPFIFYLGTILCHSDFQTALCTGEFFSLDQGQYGQFFFNFGTSIDLRHDSQIPGCVPHFPNKQFQLLQIKNPDVRLQLSEPLLTSFSQEKLFSNMYSIL